MTHDEEVLIKVILAKMYGRFEALEKSVRGIEDDLKGEATNRESLHISFDRFSKEVMEKIGSMKAYVVLTWAVILGTAMSLIAFVLSQWGGG